MSENKFMKHLRGEDTAKSLIEVKNQNTVTRFVGVPYTTDNMNDVYSDHRGNATGVLKGTENWVLKAGGLSLVPEVYGDGSDFIDSFFVSGSSMWVQNSYTFPGDKIFLPNTKFVLKLCGNNLRSQKEVIHFALLIEFSDGTIIPKKFDIRRQSGNFCKEFVVDFDESNPNLIRLSAGDRMIVSLLADDSSASAEIYNGMSVFTALQRRVDGFDVASDKHTFKDLETEVSRKVDKTGDPNKLYGTDSDGNQTLYSVSYFVGNALINAPTVGQYLRWNGTNWINMDGDGGGGSTALWGAIGGDITDQADLQAALGNKANIDLDNLSATGEARFDAKANVDLDNLSVTGQAKFDAKQDLIGGGTSGTLITNTGTPGTVSETSIDASVTQGSNNPVSSDAVFNAIQGSIGTLNGLTNCIKEIPQDIKLELDTATHTIKLTAGSKYYYPDGTNTFNNNTTTTELTLAPIGSYTGQCMIYVVTDGSALAQAILPENTSGTTPPTGNGAWYDTNTNYIKGYSGGSDTGNRYSFPIAIATRTNGNWTSIDQVFNGFGYIGSTTFVLPGVKALVPDGRNPDGTCKSTELSFTEVKVHELVYNAETSHYCILQPNGLYGYGAESIFVSDKRPLPTIDFPTYAFWYDVPNNYIWTTTDNGVTWNLVNNAIFVGSMQKPGTGNITSLNPNQAFKAIDRSDIIDLLEMIYPVGAIYTTTVNSTECPMRLVIPGSTWQLVATDRALWGGNGSNAATTIAAGLPDGRGAFTESGANVTSASGGMHKASSYSAGWGSTGGDNTATVEYRNSWWNSIYGASTTVQPPAYRVNVWRRVS